MDLPTVRGSKHGAASGGWGSQWGAAVTNMFKERLPLLWGWGAKQE